MTEPVELRRIDYVDKSGYATHLLLELSQYLPYSGGNVRIASFCVPVHGGRARLRRPGVEQVFSFTAQAMVSRSPNERELLGSAVVYRVQNSGDFVKRASIETMGNLIHRTVVEEARAVPPTLDERANTREDERDRRIDSVQPDFGVLSAPPMMPEISFLEFDYHDETTAQAIESVDVVVQGLKDEVPGSWSPADNPIHVHDGHAEWAPTDITDVTRLEFQPRDEDGNAVGNRVVKDSNRGYFLTEVEGNTIDSTNGPRSSASIVEKTPGGYAPAPSSNVITPPGTSVKPRVGGSPSEPARTP